MVGGDAGLRQVRANRRGDVAVVRMRLAAAQGPAVVRRKDRAAEVGAAHAPMHARLDDVARRVDQRQRTRHVGQQRRQRAFDHVDRFVEVAAVLQQFGQRR
ncbi:MAG TPA: hypothetical protein VHD89_01490 [Rhodanobacteraceae bacterium]|nr:hypothetical protein [Rhodanobacteraceae bacterium]